TNSSMASRRSMPFPRGGGRFGKKAIRSVAMRQQRYTPAESKSPLRIASGAGFRLTQSSSGRADRGEEIIHLPAQLLGAQAERLGGRLDVLRRGAGRVGAGGHAGDVVGRVPGAAR